jgi:hypothetical protein
MGFQEWMLARNKLSFRGLSTPASRIPIRKTVGQADGIVAGTSREISEWWGRVEWLCRSNILDGGLKNVYGEETFRPLMASERKRSERSGQAYQIILIQLSALDKSAMPMDNGMARTLFEALGRCLRETDYVGWYREKLIVGAVLTALESNTSVNDSCQIEQRIVRAFRECFSEDNFSRLQFYRWQPHELEQQNVELHFREAIM